MDANKWDIRSDGLGLSVRLHLQQQVNEKMNNRSGKLIHKALDNRQESRTNPEGLTLTGLILIQKVYSSFFFWGETLVRLL